MVASSNRIKKSEVIFYIDLITDFLKKRTLLKALENFFEKKDELTSLCSFGVVLFLKGKELKTKYNELDGIKILKFIEEFWDQREDERSYFENGLYEILAHIFKNSRRELKSYQVIILSDRPSQQSNEYHTSLYNLILKASNFETSVDVIRLGKIQSVDHKFMGDEVKLKVITSETYGGLLYCEHGKKFQGVLESLIKSKDKYNIIKTTKSQVKQEDKTFYEKLATDLISLTQDDEHIGILCQEEKCPICATYSDELHKCYNCNAAYHNCCAARYSISNNVGFNHIFRCIQCETLLKIDEEYVDQILKEQNQDLNEEIQKEKQQPKEKEIESVETEQKEEVFESQPIKKIVKVGGFFGTEITIESKPNELTDIEKHKSDKPEYFKPEKIKSTRIKHSDKKLSITTLNPPKKGGSQIRFCEICGATVKGSLFCPVCGSKLDR
ncbi:MAG: hypothetical protein P8Y70_20080 [Candidatus Lokiarchaeota archaeon]